jgi:hypothetical protein
MKIGDSPTSITTGAQLDIEKSGSRTVFMDTGKVGIGDVSPASLLTVGSGDLFQVDSTGNIVKINNVTTSFPSSQGAASTILTNNGSGTLTWSAPAGITADSLNFTDLSDSLLLDASTDIFSSGTNVLSVTNSGTGLSLRVNDDGTLTDSTPFVVDASGNVGIGDATPASLLTVGSGDPFQVTSVGKTIINPALSAAGTYESALSINPVVSGYNGTYSVKYGVDVNMTGTTAYIGGIRGIRSQINSTGYINNDGIAIEGIGAQANAEGMIGIKGSSSGGSYSRYGVWGEVSGAAAANGGFNFATDRLGTTAGYFSSALSSGSYGVGLVGKAAGATTDYGGMFYAVDAAGTTNTALYAKASGATNNYAGIFEAGNVGIGTTTPRTALDTSTGTLSGAGNDYTKAQFSMSGGGTVTWAGAGGKLKWTARLIAIPGSTTSMSVGYVEMNQPTSNIPAGQVYDGLARTADANGVILNGWEALYAVHTVTGNETAITYRIVRYNSSFDAPSNWILVAAVNGDDNSVKLGSGVIVSANGTYQAGTSSIQNQSSAAQTGNSWISGMTGIANGDYGGGGTIRFRKADGTAWDGGIYQTNGNHLMIHAGAANSIVLRDSSSNYGAWFDFGGNGFTFNNNYDDAASRGALTFYRSRSGATAPAAGFGTFLDFNLEGFTNGSQVGTSRISSLWENTQTNDTTDRDAALIFNTTVNNASAEKMRISSAGNVGIGTTGPGYLLHVGSASVTDGTTVLRLQDANSTCDFNANTGAPTCGSDETLKKNITDLGGSLSKIDALRLVEYNWKTDALGAAKQTGFVAQEVEKVFPKLVTEQKWIDGTNKKFLETAGLVPYLVGATQELSVQTKSNTTEISELKKENADMKAEISDLKTRLESLEQKLK